MQNFQKTVEIRWADLDPNFHVIHSKYYDFGADCRMVFLVENGVTPALMMEHKFGPIIFREECVFRKEILYGDKVTINLKLQSVTDDYGRWTMVHEIYKNNDTLAAVVTIDGAWINTHLRKLTLPPAEVVNLFEITPKTASFTYVEKKKE